LKDLLARQWQLILRSNWTFARFQERNQVIELAWLERRTKGWGAISTSGTLAADVSKNRNGADAFLACLTVAF
jgi:hypothetical protein